MVWIRAHALSTVTYYKILHLVGGLPPVVLAVLFAKITSPSNVKLVSVARIAVSYTHLTLPTIYSV